MLGNNNSQHLETNSFKKLFLYRIPYIETSAASGENVQEAMGMLLDLVMKRMRDYVSNMESINPADESMVGSTTPSSEVKNLQDNPKKDSSCFCF